jgi:protein-tyrosine kinase
VGIIDHAVERLRRSANAARSAKAASIANAALIAPAAITAAPRKPVYLAKRIWLDLVRLRTAGYLPEEGQELRFADYYRAIKRPIIQQALGVNAAADLRLILVSSALPGEGKTFTSVNLALSMAREHDISVLLVDADLSRSHLSRTLGVENEAGLVDSLLDETRDVESFIMRSYTRGLDFLPAGRPTAGTTELIASARMAQLASWLSIGNPRRLVVFDSAPLLVSSEARALVQIPGQIILVARAGRTPHHALLNAIAHVDKKKLHGLVLNGAYVGAGEGYYYGYGPYATKGNDTAGPVRLA